VRFAFWSQRFGQWVVESGEFLIAVGNSSRHLVATEAITLEAPGCRCHSAPTRPCTNGWQMTVAASCSPNVTYGLLQDPELIKVIGTMPMETLAAFQGMALSHGELQELIAEL
jgi:beta-glucosidase